MATSAPIEIQQHPSATGNESHHFALFAFLWAVALLAHQIQYRDTFRSPFDVALTGSALFTLLNPYSAWRLLAATGFHVLAVIHHLPDVFNHWFFAGLDSLAFVLVAATVLIRSRRLEPADLFGSFAFAARLNLICLYYFSALHKLNSDYFTPAVSCGGMTYGQLRETLPFLPASDTALLMATYSGALMELTLPTLLLTRRWRRLAVVLGLFFHLCLGLMSYARFSVIAYALLALFLPELGNGMKRVAAALSRNAPLQAALSWLHARNWLLIVLFFALAIVLRNTTGRAEVLANRFGNFAAHLTFLFFLAESAVLMVAALRVLRQFELDRAPQFGLAPTLQSGLLATALLVLSGLSPYLGLKTMNTFAMYSNLRTESGATNHFFLPAGWQQFPYQREMVDIVETNIASLQAVVEKDMLIPYQQLRNEITREMKMGRKGIRVVFLRNGQTITVANAENHPQLGVPVNAFAYKFLTFRAVEKSGGRVCTY